VGLKLIGEVALDGSGFEAGLNKLQHGAEKVGETMKGLALSAFGIYGIEQAIHHTVETAEQLIDTSRRLGISLETLQEFGYAAKQNGADIDQLTTFIEKLNSTRVDPKKFESFAKLGISQPDLSSLKVEDLILKLSSNIRNRSSQEVIGPLRDIGGKGAGALLVMLKDDLAALAEEAHKLGIIMKSEDLVALKYISDEMKTLAMVMTGMLAPAIVGLMNQIIRFINTLKANGTFWGMFTGSVKKEDWRTAVDAFLHPMSVTPERKAAMDRIKKAFTEAGAASEADLQELNDASAAMFARLMKVQKDMENVNRNPDFEVPDAKEKKSHSTQIATDSLLRVGNFLGSSNNPMISIGHQQLTVLRQIANNTSYRPAGGMEPGHRFPHK
jgi:hypothetical protein